MAAGFHGGSSSSLVLFVSFYLFFFFFLIFFLGTSSATPEDLSLIFSREELVQAAGYGEEKLSSVLVTGTVVCEACSNGEDELRAWPVEGAMVGVTCKLHGREIKARNGYRSINGAAKSTSDEYGDFIIHLPSHLHANPNLDQTCTARVLRLPKNSPCGRRPLLTSRRSRRGIKFSSAGNGIRTYTTGTISIRQKSRTTQHGSRVCLGRKGRGEEERVW